MNRLKVAPLVIVLLALAWGNCVLAQVSSTSIVGRIEDASGAGIPAAIVSVTSLETGVVRSVTTEGDGSYRVLWLPVGRYEVKAEKSGMTCAATCAAWPSPSLPESAHRRGSSSPSPRSGLRKYPTCQREEGHAHDPLSGSLCGLCDKGAGLAGRQESAIVTFSAVGLRRQVAVDANPCNCCSL